MSNNNPATEFENILNSIQGNAPKQSAVDRRNSGTNKNAKSSMMPKSSDVFESIIEQNEILDKSMRRLTGEIDNIRENHVDSFSKNLTFSLIFTALDVAIQEYEYQSIIFAQYTRLYDEMCNEENIVRVLDLLRLIVTDRRAILNDVMNNILKIQRLDNDRIKMDAGSTDEDDMDSLVTPDTM